MYFLVLKGEAYWSRRNDVNDDKKTDLHFLPMLLEGASVWAQPPDHFLSFLPVKWTCAPIGWPFPQPCHHNNYNSPPAQPAHYGNQVLFQKRSASSSSFFFGILSPTHHHTSLHVNPAQTISRDFPSNPSPALAGACVSQVLPWKPGWLGTRPKLSGTLSWLPLFSSCSPAKKKKKKRKTNQNKSSCERKRLTRS